MATQRREAHATADSVFQKGHPPLPAIGHTLIVFPRSAKFKYSASVNAIPIGPKRKIAFVCSGGGTKAGAFHIGVALALQEKGFVFQGGLQGSQPEPPVSPREISLYVGSSAGAFISSYLAAGYTLQNILNSFLGKDPGKNEDALPKPLPKLSYKSMFRLRRELAREQIRSLFTVKRVVSDLIEGNLESILQLRWLRTSGFFSTAGLEEFMRSEVLPSNSFQDYRADLFIVATQLDHPNKIVFGKSVPPIPSQAVYRTDVGIAAACAASGALPVLYAPYPIPGENGGPPMACIDGEIRDTLSSHVAFDAGADLVFASYTHQPYRLTKDLGPLSEQGLPMILIQSLYLLIEQKIQNYVHAKERQASAIQEVARYCVEQGVSREHRDAIVGILEKELRHARGSDAIYIHPAPEDSILFMTEHFSLSPQRLNAIVRAGFRAGARALSQRVFQF